MKKIGQITAIVLFLAMLYGIPVSFLIQKDIAFSENENRYLADKPLLSLENMLSGKFMEGTERYIDDQFPQRDFWVSLKSDFLRLTGRKEINGVYLAGDGYLIEKWPESEFDEKQLTENIEALNCFAKRHPEQKISVMLVPTAGMILKDKLPENAPMFDQQIAYDLVKRGLGGISYIDLIPLLTEHSTEDLYYKTDHHWTTRGAFLAYSAWCEANACSADLDSFLTELVTDKFQGSLYSKVLGSYCVADKIELYRQREEAAYDVAYNFGKMRSHTVYARERLLQKDKYQVFLNGNHPEVTIRTSQTNGRHLLIIKDSFANAFVPFLLKEYETIHLIDLRYYNGNIDDYMLENEINECLILYNIKNFCEDKNILDIAS